MDISVIIPVYNEEQNLRILHSEIHKVLTSTERSFEIIFVNDGSTDSSIQKMRQIRESDPSVKIIDLNRNFGQTAAIMAGFDHASGDILITMDGDLQNDPEDIPSLMNEIEKGYDLVSGWRKDRKDNYLTRILPSRVANKIISIMLNLSLHDYGCTLKAYKKETVEGMKLYGEMHRFIPAIAVWKGADISEIVVNHRPRRYGKTKYGLNRTVKVLLDLLLISFLSEYSTKPIRFFGGMGLASGMMGILSLLGALIMKFVSGTDLTGNPLLILSVLFLLVSVQLISMGFLGEINIRTYYESQNKKTYHVKQIIE